MINTYAIYMNLLFGVLGFTIFILNLCVLCSEKLFKLQCSEKVGTMEIRFLYFYRIP